jgi:hypothetical protein
MHEVEVVEVSDGAFAVIDRMTRDIVILDGAPLAALPEETARDHARTFSRRVLTVGGNVKVRSAIERALKHTVADIDLDMDDVVTAVRWMVADVTVDADVLRLLINRFALEIGKEIDDLARHSCTLRRQ